MRIKLAIMEFQFMVGRESGKEIEERGRGKGGGEISQYTIISGICKVDLSFF